MKNVFLIFCLLALGFPLSSQIVFGGESVEWDANGKRWFCSSDGTSIIQRDSVGNLSYFGNNLEGTHGMEIMGNTLFVCKSDRIYGYDLTTELQVMSVTVSGAIFLNGLTSNGINKLYTTDFGLKYIHEIDVTNLAAPVVTNLGSTSRKPNGIVFDPANYQLIFVNWGANATIETLNLTTLAIDPLVTTTLTNLDGIDDDGYWNYYVSSWSPARITRWDSSWSGPGTTITAPGINNPADICYAKEIDTLAIPNGNNTVTFIGFGPVTGIEETLENVQGLMVYPNPATDASYIHFELLKASEVRLSIMDLMGREVAVLLEEPKSAGRHFALLNGLGIAPGEYLVKLATGEAQTVFRMVKQE